MELGYAWDNAPWRGFWVLGFGKTISNGGWWARELLYCRIGSRPRNGTEVPPDGQRSDGTRAAAVRTDGTDARDVLVVAFGLADRPGGPGVRPSAGGARPDALG